MVIMSPPLRALLALGTGWQEAPSNLTSVEERDQFTLKSNLGATDAGVRPV